jgi:predicted site-specific integrase-resolvase
VYQSVGMLKSNPTIIVVENKDRLTRFGFNYLRRLLEKQNCKIEVINQNHEDEADFMELEEGKISLKRYKRF